MQTFKLAIIKPLILTFHYSITKLHTLLLCNSLNDWHANWKLNFFTKASASSSSSPTRHSVASFIHLPSICFMAKLRLSQKSHRHPPPLPLSISLFLSSKQSRLRKFTNSREKRKSERARAQSKNTGTPWPLCIDIVGEQAREREREGAREQ